MITDRQFPHSAEALIESILRETVDSQVIVIQAGHFLLYYDEEERRLIPCVATEMISSRQENFRRDFAGFPIHSWKLACRLLETLPAVTCYMSVLVNDWQYVPASIDRSRFFAEFAHLPTAYIDEMSVNRRVRAKLLAPTGPAEFSANQPYFSERKLRNKFRRRIEQLIKKNSLPEGIDLDLSKNGVTCNLVDVMGTKREIYCSSKDADCSSEVAELIDESFSLVRCDTFINLYPAVCKEFVEIGSELPKRLFGTGISRVINLALPSTCIANEHDLLDGAEMTIHQL